MKKRFAERKKNTSRDIIGIKLVLKSSLPKFERSDLTLFSVPKPKKIPSTDPKMVPCVVTTLPIMSA